MEQQQPLKECPTLCIEVPEVRVEETVQAHDLCPVPIVCSLSESGTGPEGPTGETGFEFRTCRPSEGPGRDPSTG